MSALQNRNCASESDNFRSQMDEAEKGNQMAYRLSMFDFRIRNSDFDSDLRMSFTVFECQISNEIFFV